MERNKIAKKCFAVLAVCTIITTVILSSFYISAYNRETQNLMKIKKVKIQNEIDNLTNNMNLIENVLVNVLEYDYDELENNREEYEILFSSVLNRDYIFNIAVLPQGIVRYIYPEEGNEASLGDNILTMNSRKKEAIITLEKGELTMGGPYELTQGGEGFIYRKAIFNTDLLSEADFWGFASIVMDYKLFVDSLELERLKNEGYEYRLNAVVNELGPVNISTSDGFNEKNATFENIEFANGYWEISISKDYDFNKITSVLGVFIVGMAISTYVYKLLKEE